MDWRLKLAGDLLGLPPLSNRIASAVDMSDCFDFNQQPAPPPLNILAGSYYVGVAHRK